MNRPVIFALYFVALAVVLRAASVYVGQDLLALGVCVTMAVVLTSGVAELIRHVTAADRMLAELHTLPSEGEDDPVARATPELAALLRGRLERAPLAVPQPIFAPYLVGMLVMLGLLGTFLGLFETLAGAKVALTASGNLEALRAGLARPIAGLVRSFGTSAAGVASSALLGLASVVARRSAQSLSDALASAAAGRFAHLSTGARERAAIEAMISQGRAMPAAAEALTEAVRALSTLGDRLATEQKASSERLDQRLVSSASAVEASLTASAAASQKKLVEVAGSVDTRLERTAGTLEKQLGLVATTLEKQLGLTATTLEKQLGASSASIEKSLGRAATSIDERLGATAGRLEASVTGHAEAVRVALEAAAAALPAAALGALEATSRSTLDALEAHAREAAAARAVAFEADRVAQRDAAQAAQAAAFAALEADREARLLADEALSARLAAHLATVESELAARSEAQQASLSGAQAALARELEAAREALAHGLASMRAADADARARTLEAEAAAFAALRAAHDEALASVRDALRDDTEARAAALLEAIRRADVASAEAQRSTLEAHAQAVLGVLTTTTTQLASASTRTSEALEASAARTAQTLEALSDTLGPKLAAATEGPAARFAAMAEHLVATAEALRVENDRQRDARAAEHARLDTLFGQLGEASESVAESAKVQATTLESLARTAAARVDAAEQASAERLVALLDRMERLVDEDRQRTERLDAALRSASVDTSEQVRTLLEARASELSGQLATTQALVHESAGLVHAGAAELGSLATAFAESVERHREAADEWMANLGRVEAAVVQAGEQAASDVLGQRLARTHEIFDRQLRFQNELLDRVRSLRDSSVGTVAAVDPDETPRADAGE